MRISTFFIVVGMLIISLYFLIDVSFYASQIVMENNTTTAVVIMPSIDVSQNINNKSVSYGVYHEPQSMKPGNGTVILFGHRTMYGSPFFKLDGLKAGDSVFLEWPGVGKGEYRVNNTFIVPASYRISVDQGEKLFLITCHPIGSARERLIVETDLVSLNPLNETFTQDNPENYYAILMILGFFVGGLMLTYFYPVNEDKKIVLVTVIALTLFLALAYLFPIPPDFITGKLSDINNLFGI